MYFTLLVVVILTAIALVAVALGVARAIAPRSYNPQKGEAYECGIPTRGKSWMQFKVGYYLFAILFLMFDVETVFLFSWAVVVQDLGIYGLVSILFFLLIWFGPGLRLAERSTRMEIRKPEIKSMRYEDFNDNEYLERMVQELRGNGTNVVVGCLDDVIEWGRSNSLWPLTFATSCCGIEFMAVGAARYDFARFGFEVARASPRQADFIMVAGTITHKMAPVLKRLYDQMADPKYVIAVGGCAISGGPFKKSYHVVKGVDEILPVDVYIPGCPPRPEAMLYGLMQLQRKVRLQRFFGGVNKQIDRKEYERLLQRDLTAERNELNVEVQSQPQEENKK